MKTFTTLLGSVALASMALAGQEQVQIDKSKAVVTPPASACDWQGFYVGINGGYAFDLHTTVSDLDLLNVGPPVESFSFDSDGGVGGGQIGYNFQPWRRLVVGVEADGGYLGVHGQRSQPGSPGNATFAEINPGAYVTARGRIGLALDCLLLYATGGWFGSDYELKLVDDEICTCGGTLGGGHCDDFRSGYTVGGGAEWMFRPHWSIRVEYLYFNTGDEIVNAGIRQAGNFRFGFDSDGGHIVRAGLNYKF